MAHKNEHGPRSTAYVFGGRYFEPVNDVGPFVDDEPRSIVARSLGIAIGTLLFGGTVIAGAITLIADLFDVPAFADHRFMGFLMAGVVGLGLALWYLATSIRWKI